MPIIGSKGAESSGGFGQFAQSGAVNYIEDVFSTWVYTGTDGSRIITNNIDLLGKGGMVWSKSRTTPGGTSPDNIITSAEAGAVNFFSMNATYLVTNSTDANFFTGSAIDAFQSTGYRIASSAYAFNELNVNYVSWTFRQQPKFFDVVAYTGNSTAGRTISHNLGSVPGCIIIKSTSLAGTNWAVYHQSLASTDVLILNGTSAAFASSYFNSTAPTSTVFSVGSSGSVNNSGDTYVAYLFASNAGGFGAAGTDNVITCGSFTTDGSGNATVSLGYEPQWVLFKNTATTDNWMVFDNMRGWPAPGTTSGRQQLKPNSSAAEASNNYTSTTSTGFTAQGLFSSNLHIYIAIRRGPMKTPTLGTSVFSPNIATGGGSGSAGDTITTNFVTDLAINQSRNVAGGADWFDRLRGNTPYLLSYSTSAEFNPGSYYINFTNSNTSVVNVDYGRTSSSYVQWSFQRAPGFFDEVCYTGTGSTTTQAHNLGVIPELIIVKKRSNATNSNWDTTFYVSASNAAAGYLNLTGSLPTVAWASTNLGAAPTASVFSIGGYSTVNESAATFVAYLFATCPGVSKVGTYTGNGTTQTINCGFAGGARFVLIKRTDSTGDWYVYDTARGMTTLTDPYLLLNTTAAESSTLGSVTTVTTGFAVNASILAAINTNAATYIFLAIA
jgi:hypothetical protein